MALNFPFSPTLKIYNTYLIDINKNDMTFPALWMH